ncbi:MAG: hypothetical protein Q6351_004860 [Candidatus Njordarchaeum guaymaensis]
MIYLTTTVKLNLKALNEEEDYKKLVLTAKFANTIFKRAYKLFCYDLTETEIKREFKYYPIHSGYRTGSIKKAHYLFLAVKRRRQNPKRQRLQNRFKLTSFGSITRGNITKVIFENEKPILEIPIADYRGYKGYRRLRIPIIANRSKREFLKSLGSKYVANIEILDIKKKLGIARFTISFKDPRKIKIPKDVIMVGVDLNPELIATTAVNSDGNPIEFREFKIRFPNKQNKDAYRNVAGHKIKEIVNYYQEKYKNIAFAVGHISKSLRIMTDSKGFQKHFPWFKYDFPYRLMESIFKSRCAREGIPIRFPTEKYSSQIAKIKYSKIFKDKSIHVLAALVIARRALGFKEKIEYSKKRKLVKNYKKKSLRLYDFIRVVP